MRDPENQPFMGSIARGECPQELDPGTRDQPVNVNLVRPDPHDLACESDAGMLGCKCDAGIHSDLDPVPGTSDQLISGNLVFRLTTNPVFP